MSDPEGSGPSGSGASVAPETLDYLEQVLSLDPREDAVERTLRRRSQLDLAHPPAFLPPFAHLPRRLRASALLGELRTRVASGEQPGDVVERLRELCLPDQVVQLERLLLFARERSRWLALRPALGDELFEVLERIFLGQSGEAVELAEGYLDSLTARPQVRARLRARVARLRAEVPALVALEPELCLGLERRGQLSGQRRKAAAFYLLLFLYALFFLARYLNR